MPKGKPTDPQKIKDQKNRGHALKAVRDAKRSGDIKKEEKAKAALKKGNENNARGYGLQAGLKYKAAGKTEKAQQAFSTAGKTGFKPGRK